MRKLGVLKEGINDKFVSLTPDGVAKLTNVFSIYVEKDAGVFSGYTDQMYEEAGAKILQNKEGIVEVSDIILSFGSKIEKLHSDKKKVFIGFFNVLNDKSVVKAYLDAPADVYSLDLIPRSTIAQAMDIISSVASISGYQAVLTAAEMSHRVIPMMSSAGGTLRPSKVLVLGAGVAGLQAIATAKRLGASVQAFDVRSNTKNEVESLGAKFIEIEGAVENANAGGYAIEQSEEYLKKVNKRIADESIDADIIITTAKIPGKKAPTLITKETVEQMKGGSVIIDLAAENGGNCELTKKGEISEYNGVQIIGLVSLLNRCSNSISYLISNNFTSFLNYYVNNIENETENEILRATKVVAEGKIINQQLIKEVIELQ